MTRQALAAFRSACWKSLSRGRCINSIISNAWHAAWAPQNQSIHMCAPAVQRFWGNTPAQAQFSRKCQVCLRFELSKWFKFKAFPNTKLNKRELFIFNADDFFLSVSFAPMHVDSISIYIHASVSSNERHPKAAKCLLFSIWHFHIEFDFRSWHTYIVLHYIISYYIIHEIFV